MFLIALIIGGINQYESSDLDGMVGDVRDAAVECREDRSGPMSYTAIPIDQNSELLHIAMNVVVMIVGGGGGA